MGWDEIKDKWATKKNNLNEFLTLDNPNNNLQTQLKPLINLK